MLSQGLFGRIAEREEQMISIHKKTSAIVPRNETEFDDRFPEMVDQRRQFVRRPRGPVEMRSKPQYAVKSSKGQFRKILLWGFYGRPTCVC